MNQNFVFCSFLAVCCFCFALLAKKCTANLRAVPLTLPPRPPFIWLVSSDFIVIWIWLITGIAPIYCFAHFISQLFNKRYTTHKQKKIELPSFACPVHSSIDNLSASCIIMSALGDRVLAEVNQLFFYHDRCLNMYAPSIIYAYLCLMHHVVSSAHLHSSNFVFSHSPS